MELTFEHSSNMDLHHQQLRDDCFALPLAFAYRMCHISNSDLTQEQRTRIEALIEEPEPQVLGLGLQGSMHQLSDAR